MNEPEIAVDFAAAEVVPLTDEQQSNVDPLESGFLWYTPPLAADPSPHSTNGHLWDISGHDMQVLTTSVPRRETIITEVGSFMFGSPGIETSLQLTLCGGGDGGNKEGVDRIMGGESCAKVLLTINGPEDGFVGLTPNFPAKIIPIVVSDPI